MQNDIRPWGEVFNTSFNRSDFGTYVGASSWIEVLLRLVRIVRVIYLFNRRLKEFGNKQQVILHVYGDVPPILLEALSKYSFVKFIGYYIEHSEFIKRLSTADLFIERFPLPDLEYTTLEAMCVGMPVAKFSMDPESEEIVDGFNGILATSDEEMVEKLTKYILSMDEMKRVLATNA
jgi:glycosyltransferase involved in cell wall biosynthesis